MVEQARRYAYHFFFRRMIPLAFLKREDFSLFFNLDIDSVDDLAPGRDAALDIVCDAILDGSPFVYPAETLGVHDWRAEEGRR